MDLKRITADEAKSLQEKEGYTVIDVRSMPEYQAEHPAGAVNIPFLHKAPYGMIPNPDFSKVVQAAFPDKNAKLITSCQMGGRSIRAAMELQNLGYKNVIDLRGGFGSERDDTGKVVAKGWKDAGLPTETGDTAGKSYKDMEARLTGGAPSASATPSPSPQPQEHAGHGHHGHSHGGHDHGGGHAAPTAAGAGGRFADPTRTVLCKKFGRELPALKRRPFPGPLGERIKAEISADAWAQWAEHSRMLINEYRMNPADPKAQAMLMQQCEKFFFGEGAELPKEYVPPKS